MTSAATTTVASILNPSVDSSELLAAAGLGGCVAARHVLPTRSAQWVDIPSVVPPPLARALHARGMAHLYSHQAEAVTRIAQGEDVVTSTETNSGKSLVYTLPSLAVTIVDPGARALWTHPTKALAADQIVALESLIRDTGCPIEVGTFDGDTPQHRRKRVRDRASIILANPDILHYTLLSSHPAWASFFANLQIVVIDELHYWGGITGSHVAHVLGRLRRICRHYGADPRFIFTSATIENAKPFAEAMLGSPVSLVERSGAPQEAHELVVANPFATDSGDQDDLAVASSCALLTAAIERGISIITFVQSRRLVEVLLRRTRHALRRRGLSADLVSGYRGGYLPEERRAIERGLRDGSILGVIATTALELGIDIGPLVVSVVLGWPGSIAAVHQMWGRAGRRGTPSLRVFLASDDPVSQFVVRNPDWFFKQSPEAAYIAPGAPDVALRQAQCAAYELAIDKNEQLPGLDQDHTCAVMTELKQRGLVVVRENRHHWIGRDAPARRVSIRGAMDQVQILDHQGRVLAEVDADTADQYVHPGAIYLHDDQQLEIVHYDPRARKAKGVSVQVTYFTRPVVKSSICIQEEHLSCETANASAGWGQLRVHRLVVAFSRISLQTGRALDHESLSLPPRTLFTEGIWITLAPSVLSRIQGYDQQRVSEGVAHALRVVGAVLSMCGHRDIQTRVTRTGLELNQTVFLHDTKRGGSGIAAGLYARLPELLDEAVRLVDGCPCTAGCPRCTGPGDAVEGLREDVRKVLRGMKGLKGGR